PGGFTSEVAKGANLVFLHFNGVAVVIVTIAQLKSGRVRAMIKTLDEGEDGGVS
ncbi:hypothetical protein A2U01_0106163, partial [Trifolium medium]|nr:hypothetical protein [Trifolium medium]